MLDIGKSYGLVYTEKDWLRSNPFVESNNKFVMSASRHSLLKSYDGNGNISWMLSGKQKLLYIETKSSKYRFLY